MMHLLKIVTRRFFIAVITISLGLWSCENNQTESGDKESASSSGEPSAFTEEIKEAHNTRKWYQAKAYRARIDVEFGGSPILAGTMTFDPALSKSKMILDNGAMGIYKDGKAGILPADSLFPRGEFHLLTWSYFMAAPHKLDDKGTKLKAFENLPLKEGGEVYPTHKLTFDAEVGETPNDWYILYQDNNTNQLKAMSYIVTFGKDTANVDQIEPHLILYKDYQKVDGIPISTTWDFYRWSKDRGYYGESIGHVELSHIERLVADSSYWDYTTNPQ